MAPIKGISEVRRLPRLGKIRLGVKKKTEKGVEYPSAVDYFVCPEEVQKVFGKKPKELRIMFPIEDETKWASQWLKCYSATRGLICKGDGETALALIDVATGGISTKDSLVVEMKEVPCNPDSCPEYQSKQCRRVMALQFLLPEVPGLGIYELDTTSFYSIVNINSAIDMTRGMFGRIAMIPLTLSLGPQEVQPEGRKKSVHVLTLTSPYTLSELAERVVQPLIAEPLKVVLPEPSAEVPEELFPPEVIAEEPPAELLAEAIPEGEAAGEAPLFEEQRVIERNHSLIKNHNMFYNACFEDFKLQPREALKMSGYASPTDVISWPMAYLNVAGSMGARVVMPRT